MNVTNRKAYIGVSYPLFYDYSTCAYVKGQKKSGRMPNPVIESPVGLLILFDELWFISRAVCPINMRKLPYVHFVDEEIPDFDFKKLYENLLNDIECSIECKPLPEEFKKYLYENGMNLDVHSRTIKLGKTEVFLRSTEYNFIFDYYVVEALRETFGYDVELVTNSIFNMVSSVEASTLEFIERISIKNIPNYITKLGPYHECFEELRENEFLRDFRKWIIEDHSHIQKSEITERSSDVEKQIKEAQEKTYIKTLRNGGTGKFFFSTGKTTLMTAAGIMTPLTTIIDVASSIIGRAKGVLDYKGNRWQGFVIQSNNIDLK